jgi:hypothetical protein
VNHRCHKIRLEKFVAVNKLLLRLEARWLHFLNQKVKKGVEIPGGDGIN